MFIDEAEITVFGGVGGNGTVSFFPMRGGPCGGNGGNGGNVYFKVSTNVTTLKKYVMQREFKASDGKVGMSNNRVGATGKDLILPIPPNTSVIDLDSTKKNELKNNNDQVLICHGGKGGLGNSAFKSSTNRTPRRAYPGEPGEVKHIKLILKLIADYGFIGLPNAGKSSLLNELTSAQAKTANYPFTTLQPNLGAFGTRILADIPGIIEGASSGKGLGIKFLKHIEKVTLLLHCISVESSDVIADYNVVREELGKYNMVLLQKKEIILLTKIDLVPEEEKKAKINILKKISPNVYPISIHDWDSIEQLKKLLN